MMFSVTRRVIANPYSRDAAQDQHAGRSTRSASPSATAVGAEQRAAPRRAGAAFRLEVWVIGFLLG